MWFDHSLTFLGPKDTESFQTKNSIVGRETQFGQSRRERDGEQRRVQRGVDTSRRISRVATV